MCALLLLGRSRPNNRQLKCESGNRSIFLGCFQSTSHTEVGDADTGFAFLLRTFLHGHCHVEGDCLKAFTGVGYGPKASTFFTWDMLNRRSNFGISLHNPFLGFSDSKDYFFQRLRDKFFQIHEDNLALCFCRDYAAKSGACHPRANVFKSSLGIDMLHPLNNPAKDRPIYRPDKSDAFIAARYPKERKDSVNMRPIFNHKEKPCSNIASKIERW